MRPIAVGSTFASEIGAELATRGLARSRCYGTKVAEYWTEVGTLGRITKVWAQGAKWPEYLKLRLYFTDTFDMDLVIKAVEKANLNSGLRIIPAKTADRDPRCECAVDVVFSEGEGARASNDPRIVIDAFKNLLAVAAAA